MVDNFSQTVDKIISRYDMLNRNISETLIEICDVVDLKNMVQKLHVLLKIQNLLW
jgi:hypothetical protein